MYIFELLYRFINKKYERENKYDPLKESVENEEESCEHVFLPIDSSGEVLACSKCGLVVNKSDMKGKNIFKI
ncbi:hypothetical protein IJF81_06290 [bacterium]|nr:hypothetical protein [bacterium]